MYRVSQPKNEAICHNQLIIIIIIFLHTDTVPVVVYRVVVKEVVQNGYVE